MQRVKRRIIWIYVSLSLLLTGCEALEPLTDIGKSLGDLFNNFKLPGP
jgi:hypothetical protein